MKLLHKHARNCFTLIELLLVLVILAVLAAVVVPKFTDRTKQAKITAAKTDISSLQGAIDIYEIDTGSYPTTDEGLDALMERPSSVNNESDWRGPYIKKGVPKDPWGNEYVYKYPGDHNDNGYDLHSYGPDGKNDTDDDIINWSEDD